MYCCLSIISGTNLSSHEAISACQPPKRLAHYNIASAKLIKKIVTPHKAPFFLSLIIKNVFSVSCFLVFLVICQYVKNVRLFGDEPTWSIRHTISAFHEQNEKNVLFLGETRKSLFFCTQRKIKDEWQKPKDFWPLTLYLRLLTLWQNILTRMPP